MHIFILLCRVTSSDISLTSPALSAVREQPLTLTQSSWTGTAARQQAQRHFTRCCNSSTRAASRPVRSRPVGAAAAADKTRHTPTLTHASLPSGHASEESGQVSSDRRQAVRLRHRASAPVCLRCGGRQPSA